MGKPTNLARLSTNLISDAVGNIGIGTSSPGSALDVTRSSSPAIRLTDTAGAGTRGGNIIGSWGGNGIYLDSLGASGWVYVGSSPGGGQATTIRFDTANTERMRIDSSGTLCIGRTAGQGGGLAQTGVLIGSNGSSTPALIEIIKPVGNSIVFYTNSQQVGSITTTSGGTAYNTSSDYRLKENIQPMQNALSVVQQLNPVTYNWKADGSDGQGFIAHELQAVVPDCVTGEKDAVREVDVLDEDGKKIGVKEEPVYQGIDTSFLVATLCKAIQELKAEVDSLKAQLNPT